MKLQFALVAQSVAVDRFTNRLSIFNVVERFESPYFPIMAMELVVVVVLTREPNEPETFDTTMYARLGEVVIGQSNLHVDFSGTPGTRLLTNLQGLPVMHPGELEFSFQLPNGEMVSATVPVVQVQAPIAPPIVPGGNAHLPSTP